MIGIVVVAHGELASAMVSTAEMILGSQEYVHAIGLDPDHGLQDMVSELENWLQAMEERVDSVLVLTDLYGGTPSNAACLLFGKYALPIVSGCNLPMLLEVIVQRDSKSAPELVELAIRAGKEGVKNTHRILEERLGETGGSLRAE